MAITPHVPNHNETYEGGRIMATRKTITKSKPATPRNQIKIKLERNMAAGKKVMDAILRAKTLLSVLDCAARNDESVIGEATELLIMAKELIEDAAEKLAQIEYWGFISGSAEERAARDLTQPG